LEGSTFADALDGSQDDWGEMGGLRGAEAVSQAVRMGEGEELGRLVAKRIAVGFGEKGESRGTRRCWRKGIVER